MYMTQLVCYDMNIKMHVHVNATLFAVLANDYTFISKTTTHL